jgi:hypothetical protein
MLRITRIEPVFAIFLVPAKRRLVVSVSLDEAEPRLPEAYKDYTDVFSKTEAGKLPDFTRVMHSINIEERKIVFFGFIYPLSAVELRVLREYLKFNLIKRWIQKSRSPARAPILFTPKKDGILRLCVDYRGLNRITVKNRYPLPLISETIDRLSKAVRYIKLDLRDAFYYIRIKIGDEWKTVFRTRYGYFEYLIMPFELTNAPATF